ncbi:zinc finger protein 600-like [Wyeomyia smithii]|uniref:zinc finger protein 600-like n=1 Tax=Wyeomyia smithii TaxID=174621 RepID=UPI00246803D6|nr:zinc finger protein 600-like [Wyeomyia smithii]
MDYNSFNDKHYSVPGHSAAGGSGFFHPNSSGGFLKVPNPSIILKQENIASGSSSGAATPPVNYSQTAPVYNEPNVHVDDSKPIYYAKPLDLQLISGPYLAHPQQSAQQAVAPFHMSHEFHHDHSNASTISSGVDPQHNSYSVQPSPVHTGVILQHNSFAPAAPAKASYCCEMCGKSFDSKVKLEKHHRTHNEEPTFECRMCEKKFRSQSTLTCHEKVHGENGVDNKYSCVTCGKVFKAQDKLQIHMRLHTGEKPYQCKICFKCFNHQSNLIVHSRIHETVKKALKCDRCNKVLDNEQRLAIHMRLHTGEKPYKCSYCDKRFNHKSTVCTHEKTVHISSNAYKCSRCHKTFNQKCQLQYHEKLQEPHVIACTMCEKVFCYKASHKEHMFKAHLPRQSKSRLLYAGNASVGEGEGSGRNKFHCNICDRRFYYKRALEMHMGVHDASLDVNVLYFSCNYCPETFTDEEPLHKHEAEHIANNTTDFMENLKSQEQLETPESGQVEGKYRCPLCFNRFDELSALRDHHKTHLCSNPEECDKCKPSLAEDCDLSQSNYDESEDNRETQCHICERVLPSFELFQNHFHYHTSRVPFYCYHCREEFHDKKELYAHTKTHAPRDAESYTCEICAKVFSTKGNFRRHLKSHEAVRAFACDRCFKQFDYKSALDSHLRKAHGIEYT